MNDVIFKDYSIIIFTISAYLGIIYHYFFYTMTKKQDNIVINMFRIAFISFTIWALCQIERVCRVINYDLSVQYAVYSISSILIGCFLFFWAFKNVLSMKNIVYTISEDMRVITIISVTACILTMFKIF